MAIPSTPTWTATISAAMISAGRLNVSSTEVSNMASRGAQDVKTELWSASRFDTLLATETLVLVSTGTSAFTLPPDFDHEGTLSIFDGGGGLRNRAQAGNTQALTLAANDGASDGDYVGAYVFLLAGLGAGQYNQVTFNTASTKVLSLTHAWATTPDSTTDYLIAQSSWELTRYGDKVPVTHPTRPSVYRLVGQTLTLYPAPDQVYPLVMVYSPNLTMIDETSAIFITWLKRRMALVKQGIKVQTMLLYDDERYPQQLAIWEAMKAAYGAQNPTYSHMERSR
jgi:hypothetical protein